MPALPLAGLEPAILEMRPPLVVLPLHAKRPQGADDGLAPLARRQRVQRHVRPGPQAREAQPVFGAQDVHGVVQAERQQQYAVVADVLVQFAHQLAALRGDRYGLELVHRQHDGRVLGPECAVGVQTVAQAAALRQAERTVQQLHGRLPSEGGCRGGSHPGSDRLQALGQGPAQRHMAKQRRPEIPRRGVERTHAEPDDAHRAACHLATGPPLGQLPRQRRLAGARHAQHHCRGPFGAALGDVDDGGVEALELPPAPHEDERRGAVGAVDVAAHVVEDSHAAIIWRAAPAAAERRQRPGSGSSE